MARIMPIYGTRPEAVKMAPVIHELRRRGHEVTVAVTGQHREMLFQTHAAFDIVADHDLDIMRPGATLPELAARALDSCGRLLGTDHPDLVIVQGDTSSAFAAALAGFYLKVPVVHLEAGLRTGNPVLPFPEEANRRLIAPLAALHLAPTSVAAQNLLAEGIDPGTVVTTGNTVIDALGMAVGQPRHFEDPRVADACASDAPLLLVTAHRREAWGAPMAEAMGAIRQILRERPDLLCVVPMHHNELVREVIRPALGDLPNALLTEPLSYLEFCHVMQRSTLVLTDSGGVQEEAPSLGVPVLVMREDTERPEGVSAGTVRLVGTDHTAITQAVAELLDDAERYGAMAQAINPYGDGHAAARCAAAIEQLLGVGLRLPDFVPSAQTIDRGAEWA